MKKNLFVLLLTATSFFSTRAFAQNVSINEDNSAANTNAILDVKSSTKGVLFPRMGKFTRISMPNVRGMLVFDTTFNAFMYNDGAQWISMAPPVIVPPPPAWGLKGNIGLDSNSFLGTQDGGGPLRIRVNNKPSGLIDPVRRHTFFGFNSGNTGPNNGLDNTGIGTNVLSNNTTGAANIAIGGSSMTLNTTGNDNTAVGYLSLDSNTTGGVNTAVGYASLSHNRDGGANTATGVSALFFNTSGNFNVAVGSNSIQDNTNGSENTAIGTSAMETNTSGNENVAVGMLALHENTTGTRNTALGTEANVASGNLTNATAIGFGAIVNASNKVRIGNPSVTVIEGQVPFTTPSDARFKYQVQDDVKGLSFIMQLHPVTYHFDVQRFDEQQGNPEGARIAKPTNYAIQASYKEAAGIRRSGFIAQEVEKAANATGYDFSGIIKPRTAQDHYGLSYEAFVVPLVKAVQELGTEVERLKKENESVKKTNEQLLQSLQQQIDELRNARNSGK